MLMAETIRHIASIGALLTILVLAFDIFTQQVVSIRYQNAAETDTRLDTAGAVPRTEYYESYTHGGILAGKYLILLIHNSILNK
jgi:hypothetical protein